MTPRQREFLDDLLLIENAQERLAIIVERARHGSAERGLSAAERSPALLVPGCISQVWLLCEQAGDSASDTSCRFRCDADGPLVKGLVRLLCDFYSGCTAAEILACEAEGCDPLAELALLATLSPTRRGGLAAVRARIHRFAQAQAGALHQ